MEIASSSTSTFKVKKAQAARRKRIAGFLFVLPAITFTMIFFIIPLIMTIWMSFHDWPLLGEHAFTGIENYQDMMTDDQFFDSLRFTVKYTVLVTPAIFFLGFLLASLVNLPLRGVGFFRTAYFVPYVIGLGASSLLWVWLLNGRVGIINEILKQLHIIDRSIIWMGKIDTALFAIIVSIVWKTVGFTMVLLLTGMQSIPVELYNAAMVDGAGYFSRLRFITLPLLRPTIALAMVLSVIGSFLAFDQFYIMTAGGPRNQTITVVYWIFNNSFTYFKMGYGAALSIVLLIILVVLSTIQLRLIRTDTGL